MPALEATQARSTKPLLNESDLANLFSVSVGTIQRWGREGRLPAHTAIGRHRYWKRAAIADLLGASSNGRPHVGVGA